MKDIQMQAYNNTKLDIFKTTPINCSMNYFAVHNPWDDFLALDIHCNIFSLVWGQIIQSHQARMSGFFSKDMRFVKQIICR